MRGSREARWLSEAYGVVSSIFLPPLSSSLFHQLQLKLRGKYSVRSTPYGVPKQETIHPQEERATPLAGVLIVG